MHLDCPSLLRCTPLWLALSACWALMSAAGAARAGVVVPPMSAAIVDVCRGQPCLAALPPAPPVHKRSSKRATRRST